MTTGELIKILADYCPDTLVGVTMDGETVLAVTLGEYDEVNTLVLHAR